MSISRLMALMRCVVSLALFLRSFKMDLFSLKMRLISLPRSFLKSSKATGLGGGVLGLKTEGEGKGGQSHQALRLSSRGTGGGGVLWAGGQNSQAHCDGTAPPSLSLCTQGHVTIAESEDGKEKYKKQKTKQKTTCYLLATTLWSISFRDFFDTFFNV